MRLTASSLARAAACPASAVLPGSNSTSHYATRGTVIHAYLQRCQEIGRDAAIDEVSDEWRDVCVAIDTTDLPVNGDYAAEVTFAFDLATGRARELGRGLNRDYSSCTATEICGTADVVALMDDAAYVGDFKSGHKDLPSARDGWQSRFLSLCAARVYGRERVVSDVIRVRPDEDPYTARAEFDGFDLAMTASALATLVARVQTVRDDFSLGFLPEVAEGEHCRYCPALHTCPAKIALVRTLADASPMATIEDLVGELTPASAGEAYRRVKAVESVIALVKSRVYELARTHPIPLGGGEYLGEQTAPGNEKLDGDGAYQLARDMYGDEIAELIAPADRSATKKAITSAMRKLKGLGKIKTIATGERDLLDRLRETGCARKDIVTKVTTYRAAECRSDGCIEQALTDGGTCATCSIAADYSEREAG